MALHPHPYRTVIWDADGTLYNSPPVSIRKHQLIASNLGLRIPSVDEFCQLFHKPWNELLQTLWGTDAERFTQAFIQAHSGDIYPAFPGIADTLRTLYELGIPQAVLTNRDTASCVRRLQEANLPLEVFKSIDGIEGRDHHKPDPRALERLWPQLLTTDLQPSEVVYVGDTVSDALFAQAVGCAFIAVATYVNTQEDFLAAHIPPTHILEQPRNVLQFFQ
jgi:phosphoglycolate phosphatase